MQSLLTQHDYCGVEWVEDPHGESQLTVKDPERYMILFSVLGMLDLSCSGAPRQANALAKMFIRSDIQEVIKVLGDQQNRAGLLNGLKNTDTTLIKMKESDCVLVEMIRRLEVDMRAVHLVCTTDVKLVLASC